jgi:hypothetical protein
MPTASSWPHNVNASTGTTVLDINGYARGLYTLQVIRCGAARTFQMLGH